jgi:hypothetical protein
MRTATLRRPLAAVMLLACAGLAACATKKPVLYPNAYYRQVGAEAGEVDIEDCMSLAKSGVGDRSAAASAAGGSVVGGGAGAAVGAVGGAISGGAGTGAAVGAATGATAGLLGGLWRARDHDPVFMAYVDTCLGERGYQPIGWK